MDPDGAFEAYKTKIGERLTKKLISALEEKKITEQELPEIAGYILDNIDKAKTNSDLLNFIEHLAGKWAIFADVLAVEEAETHESNKDEKIEQVENLIDQNKIDEALQTATQTNDQIQGGTN